MTATTDFVGVRVFPDLSDQIVSIDTRDSTASAKQVRYALNDLGVRTAWNAAVAASSQGGQDYWTSAGPMIEDNAKRCAAAGITPEALFDNAVTQ